MTIERWREIDGDNTLALDWPLTEDSHVWEIGGFEGRWAQQIWDKYHCHIDIFEPQMWAVEKLHRRFKGIGKIKIHPYGLWTETTQLLIGNYHTDGASVVKDDGREPKQVGDFRDFRKVFGEFPGKNIDLMLMNIEGAEYTLIPAFVEFGLMTSVFDFMCQFHPFRDVDLYRSIESLQTIFKDSHDVLWDYFPTAVAWRMQEDLRSFVEAN